VCGLREGSGVERPIYPDRPISTIKTDRRPVNRHKFKKKLEIKIEIKTLRPND